MPNYSQTTVIGHLGNDPDIRYLPNGDPVANFSIAVTESWKDKATGEKKEVTTWFRVNAFGKLAEICGQYLKKGAACMVVGKIQSRKWTDKGNVERESWELKADTMQMLGGRSTEQAPAKSSNKDDDSDLPF